MISFVCIHGRVYPMRPSPLAARKNKKSVASKSILTPANKAAVCGFRHDRKNVQFFFLVFCVHYFETIPCSLCTKVFNVIIHKKLDSCHVRYVSVDV